MTNLSLPPLRDVIRTHGLSARKGLGQHFLLDMNLTRKIARASGSLEGVTVYEVGPGPGGLTRALLSEGAAHVVAVEKDSRCLAALETLQAAYPGRLTVIEGDALDVNEAAVLGEFTAEGAPLRVIANLPYNVGSALLVKWLSAEIWPSWWQSLTLMFQKEVAERLVAEPRSKAYGRLSVLAGWRSRPKMLFDVAASAFTPPPKVTSTLVQIVPEAPLQSGLSLSALEALTATVFGQRRKMLRTVLKGRIGDPIALLEGLDIPPTARAEELTILEICRLAKAVKEA